MTELKYDPELPYAIEMQPGLIWARFRVEGDAHNFVERESGVVVDTTPKPKIPEDANYIFVEDNDQSVFAARMIGPDKKEFWMMAGNGPVSMEELLEYIGDETVMVMIEKEES